MDEEIKKTIKEILEDAMDVKGIGIERLSEITDIPERYIKAIIAENITALPASPYVRGYLIRIAEALDLSGNELWQIYKTDLELKTSGGKDKLPHNRFEQKPLKKKNVLYVILAIIALIYLAFQADRLLGVPPIDISSPPADNLVVSDSSINLRGKIDSRDKLTINGEEVIPDENGYFENQFSLETGMNSVNFKVKRLLGREVEVVRKVIYQQEQQ